MISLQLLAVLIACGAIFVTSLFLDISAVINAIKFGYNIVTGIFFAFVGIAFYFILRVAGIFETQKEIKDFLFYEMKESLESNRFTFLNPEAVKKINALIKLSDPIGETYYIVVNDDYKTLHHVSPGGLGVTIDQSSIRFMQDNFFSVDDLVNYINSRTRHKVDKYELIFDGLPD